MGKLSPSTLQRLLDELDSYELSKSKKDAIRTLVEAELYRRTEENSFREFHNWIRRGDQILSDIEHRLFQIQKLESPDGGLIDKSSVLKLIDCFDFSNPVSESEKAIHWVLSGVRREIEKLPATQK